MTTFQITRAADVAGLLFEALASRRDVTGDSLAPYPDRIVGRWEG